jgi:hypothetical protein
LLLAKPREESGEIKMIDPTVGAPDLRSQVVDMRRMKAFPEGSVYEMCI